MIIEKIIKNKDIQELIDKEFEEYEDQYSIEYNKTPFCFAKNL